MKFLDFLSEQEDIIRPGSYRDEGDNRTYMFFIGEIGPYMLEITKTGNNYRVDFSYQRHYTKGGEGINSMTVFKKVANRLKHHMNEFGLNVEDYEFPTIDKKRERVFTKFMSREL